jgi:competence protein ComEC
MNTPVLRVLLLAIAAGPRCVTGTAPPAPGQAQAQAQRQVPGTTSDVPIVDARPSACGSTGEMAIHFYDVGEGLAALVALPDGRHVLVDAGDNPRRAGCGPACEESHAHLLAKLREDLRGAPIDLLWVTHQHSDHIGGVPEIVDAFPVRAYVDNGRDLDAPDVRRAHRAAQARGVPVVRVDPGHRSAPLPSSPGVALTPILPPEWPPSCDHDPNDCSIALRVDYCASSALFTGDAEHAEERALEVDAPVTLLQVAHHGSDSSTSPAILARARPRYAVISAGRRGEGMNREYCLPRAIVVRRLTRALGGPGRASIEAFDGERCDRATAADWVEIPASDRLWDTARDGDVVLGTRGDGAFRRDR